MSLSTTRTLLALTTSFLLGLIVLAATPPISRDALTHHLYVPKLWLKAGNIAPIPGIDFSYYPMNLDVLYLLPLSLGNDIAPKFIHLFFGLVTAWMIFWYLRKRLSTNWGLFGALFFLSLPVITKLSITAYVDLGVIAFTTASLLLLLQWAETNKLSHLVLAGLFCGLAAGTKYNALISVFLLTLFVPLIYIRTNTPPKNNPSTKAIGYCVLFFLFVISSYSPWLIRNYNATGNPIYPLHHSLFVKDSTKDASVETVLTEKIQHTKTIAQVLTSRGSSVFAQRKILYQETWWQALLLPVRFFIEGKDDAPRYFDGKLNPFLLVFLFLAFYHYRYPRQVKIELFVFLSFGWLFFFLTFFQEALRIRYIASALPFFVILATFGVHNLYHRLKILINSRLTHGAIIILLTMPVLMYNGVYFVSQFNHLKPLAYITGKESRDDFLSRHLPEYPVQKWANENLEPDDRILAIYVGNRGYYFDNPVIMDIHSNNSRLGALVQKATVTKDILQGLRNLGVTHLFIRFDLFERGVNANLTRDQIDLLNLFFKTNSRKLFANTLFGLFALHEDEGNGTELTTNSSINP